MTEVLEANLTLSIGEQPYTNASPCTMLKNNTSYYTKRQPHITLESVGFVKILEGIGFTRVLKGVGFALNISSSVIRSSCLKLYYLQKTRKTKSYNQNRKAQKSGHKDRAGQVIRVIKVRS